MSYETMKVGSEAGVTTVWFTRPEVRNAVSMQFCLDLAAVFDELAWDDQTRVVLLRGEDPVFCAGADLKEREGWDEVQLRRRRLVGKEAFQKVVNCPKPVLASVQGAAVGAGAELALIADFSYAAQGTIFRWPEVVWGSVGATQRLARRVGKAHAKELLFTGATIDAQEAARLGIVNKVFPADELGDASVATAQDIAQRLPITLGETKRAIDVGTEVPLTIGLEIERAGVEIGMRSDEWRQGIDAFTQR